MRFTNANANQLINTIQEVLNKLTPELKTKAQLVDPYTILLLNLDIGRLKSLIFALEMFKSIKANQEVEEVFTIEDKVYVLSIARDSNFNDLKEFMDKLIASFTFNLQLASYSIPQEETSAQKSVLKPR